MNKLFPTRRFEIPEFPGCEVVFSQFEDNGWYISDIKGVDLEIWRYLVTEFNHRIRVSVILGMALVSDGLSHFAQLIELSTRQMTPEDWLDVFGKITPTPIPPGLAKYAEVEGGEFGILLTILEEFDVTEYWPTELKEVTHEKMELV